MNVLALTDWQDKADRLDIEAQAFIDGQYVDALSGQTRPTLNVGTGEILCDVANCGPEDADRAIVIARKTFESGVWANMPPIERKLTMVRWAELIEKHAEELALLDICIMKK